MYQISLKKLHILSFILKSSYRVKSLRKYPCQIGGFELVFGITTRWNYNTLVLNLKGKNYEIWDDISCITSIGWMPEQQKTPACIYVATMHTNVTS